MPLMRAWLPSLGLCLFLPLPALAAPHGVRLTYDSDPRYGVAVAWNRATGRKHDIAGPAARPKAEAREETTPAQRKRKAG